MGTPLETGTPKRSLIAVLIATTTFAMAIPHNSWAFIAPSDLSQGAQAAQETSAATREQDMKIIQKTLESKILRQRLQEYGFSPAETDRRLTKLSDAQVHQLAMQTQRLNPGGDLLIALLIVGILSALCLSTCSNA